MDPFHFQNNAKFNNLREARENLMRKEICEVLVSIFKNIAFRYVFFFVSTIVNLNLVL